MSGTSYDYSTRKGIRPISWNDFHGLVKALVVVVAPWQPQIILPVGRGGYYPGALLAHIMQVEVFPVCLSRRINDIVVCESPRWLLEPPPIVAGQRVVVVDEMCSTGATLSEVKKRALELGASEVRTAVLFAHTWSIAVPDYIALITDELVMNPWDREIYLEGEFVFHPEYEEALAHQGQTVEPSLKIPATPFVVAKP